MAWVRASGRLRSIDKPLAYSGGKEASLEPTHQPRNAKVASAVRKTTRARSLENNRRPRYTQEMEGFCPTKLVRRIRRSRQGRRCGPIARIARAGHAKEPARCIIRSIHGLESTVGCSSADCVRRTPHGGSPNQQCPASDAGYLDPCTKNVVIGSFAQHAAHETRIHQP